MINNVYAIFDIKSESYTQPSFMQNDAVARRSVHHLIENPGSTYHSHPEDYTLYNLGTYDERTGTFDLLTDYYPVAKFLDIIAEKQQ